MPELHLHCSNRYRAGYSHGEAHIPIKPHVTVVNDASFLTVMYLQTEQGKYN